MGQPALGDVRLAPGTTTPAFSVAIPTWGTVRLRRRLGTAGRRHIHRQQRGHVNYHSDDSDNNHKNQEVIITNIDQGSPCAAGMLAKGVNRR